MAQSVVYPDPHPEIYTVDGWVSHGDGPPYTWADLRTGVGHYAYADATEINICDIGAHTTTNKWRELWRSILLFRVPIIPSGATVSATLTVPGREKNDGLACLPDINVYASAPASNNALVAGDFDSLGSTPLCDTPIAYADFEVNHSVYKPNDFILNAAGLALLATASAGDRILKLGFRNANYDVANVIPTWGAGGTTYINIHSAEKAEETGYELFRPKLTINYSIVSPSQALGRVTGLVYRWSAGPNPVYQLEIIQGGLFSQYFSPVSPIKEPEPTMRQAARPIPLMRPTLYEYGVWLGTHTQEEQRALLRGIPGAEALTLRVWQDWVMRLRMMGQEIP